MKEERKIDMNILVTGAAGFIGRHLMEALGNKASGLDIASMEGLQTLCVNVDITDEKAMSQIEIVHPNKKEYQAVVHLAAVASPHVAQKNPIQAWATNVLGTHNVLQLARRLKCKKVIFPSSAHVYGISPKYMPTDENHPLSLHDTYTTTKIVGEKLCQLFYENYGLSYTTLRLWNVYGPGQSKDFFIGAKIAQAKAGDLTIRNEGVTKDWVHVKDIVDATILALQSDYVGPLNVGTGIETNLTKIISQIAESFHRKVVRENVPDDGPTRMLCDFGRIQKTLGWKPTTSFSEGLADLINREK